MGDPVVINDLLCFLSNQRVMWSKELLVTVVKRHFPLETIAESVRILRQRISGDEADRLTLDTLNVEVDCESCRAVRLIEALLAILDICDHNGRPLPSFGTTSPTSLPQLASLKEENGVVRYLVEEIRSLKALLLNGPSISPSSAPCHRCVRLFSTNNSTLSEDHLSEGPPLSRRLPDIDALMLQSSRLASPPSCHGDAVIEHSSSTSSMGKCCKPLDLAVERLKAKAEPKSSDISNPSSPESGDAADQSDSGVVTPESPSVCLDLRVKVAMVSKQSGSPPTGNRLQLGEYPSINDLMAAYDIPADRLKQEPVREEHSEDDSDGPKCTGHSATPNVTPKPSPMDSQLSNSGTSATASPEEFGGEMPLSAAARFAASHLALSHQPYPRLDSRMPGGINNESSPMTTPPSPFLLMPNINSVMLNAVNAAKAAGLFNVQRPFDPSGHNPMTPFNGLPSPFLQNFHNFLSGQHQQVAPPVSVNRGGRRKKTKLRPPSRGEELEANDVENTSLTPNTTKTGSGSEADDGDNEMDDGEPTDFLDGSADDNEAFKPFVCQHSNCSKRFANKFLLKKHEFIHTGERPHQCPYCGKRFNRKDNLLRHKKTHIANFGGGARKRSVFGVIDKSVVKCVASLHDVTDSVPLNSDSVTTTPPPIGGDLE